MYILRHLEVLANVLEVIRQIVVPNVVIRLAVRVVRISLIFQHTFQVAPERLRIWMPKTSLRRGVNQLPMLSIGRLILRTGRNKKNNPGKRLTPSHLIPRNRPSDQQFINQQHQLQLLALDLVPLPFPSHRHSVVSQVF